MRGFVCLALVLGVAGCVQDEPGDTEFDAARGRYVELVAGVQAPGTEERAAVERPSPLTLDSRPTVLMRYESPCVLLFSGPNCGPCVTAVREFVPRLQQRGWRVHVIDEVADPQAFAECGVDAKPTFVCVRRGVECGRSIGADWSALCAMLRRANERRFSATR